MIATFKLINSYFWKTFYGPILSFLFPILILAILGSVMRIQYIYPGIIAMTMLFLGVLALPLAIMELKGSSLFKYIGSSPVNPMKFSFVVIFYYTFISIITGFVIMFAAMIIFKNDVFHKKGFEYGILGGLTTIKGFFSFYTASFLHLMLVVSFGLVIATFSKTAQQALTFSIIIIIPSMFLSGMVVSVDIIAESLVMQWISRFSPFRYSTGNLVVSTTPMNQLGDLFQNISMAEKELIFNEDILHDVAYDNGVIYGYINKDNGEVSQYKNNNTTYFVLTSSKEVIDFVKTKSIKYDNTILNPELAPFANSFFADKHLYSLIFSNESALYTSDNNIFDWSEAWVVRRVPSTTSLKTFITEYFRGDDGVGGDVNRYTNIYFSQIQNGKFDFLHLFFTQSNILYTQAEKILNMLLPLTMIGGSIVYIIKKFSWSSR